MMEQNINVALHSATRGFLVTVIVILNHGQVTRTTPELAHLSPNYPTTPTGGRLRLDGLFHASAPFLSRVFGGTRLELTTHRPQVHYA
ncbi:hypothetical protein TNCV_2306391 [Trichonephila clavipes]|nr:hypothetical protein TNCV_2306391 [Trichonephila clavipes]